jgi:hypothetical protein
MRGLQGRYHCRNCNKPYMARVADRQRGWALYCSKSCKQITQEEAKKIWNVLRSKNHAL